MAISPKDSDDCNPLLFSNFGSPLLLSCQKNIEYMYTPHCFILSILKGTWFLQPSVHCTVWRHQQWSNWWPHLNFALRFWSRRVRSCRTALSWWHSAPLAPRSSSTALGSSRLTPVPSVRC